MHIVLFSLIITLGLIIIGLLILKSFDILDEVSIVFTIVVLSLAIGCLTYFICDNEHLVSLKSPMICVSNYIENSIEENDDDAIEDEIEKILNKTLINEARNISVSSYTNEKSQIRIVKINLEVGRIVYDNYNYEYVVNLKTKEVEKI